MLQSYDPLSPYFVANFGHRETLNRHSRNGIGKYTEENLGTIWEDIYTENNDRYCEEIA